MEHISISLMRAMIERYAQGKISRFELVYAIAHILDTHSKELPVIRAD